MAGWSGSAVLPHRGIASLDRGVLYIALQASWFNVVVRESELECMVGLTVWRAVAFLFNLFNHVANGIGLHQWRLLASLTTQTLFDMAFHCGFMQKLLSWRTNKKRAEKKICAVFVM